DRTWMPRCPASDMSMWFSPVAGVAIMRNAGAAFMTSRSMRWRRRTHSTLAPATAASSPSRSRSANTTSPALDRSSAARGEKRCDSVTRIFLGVMSGSCRTGWPSWLGGKQTVVAVSDHGFVQLLVRDLAALVLLDQIAHGPHQAAADIRRVVFDYGIHG